MSRLPGWVRAALLGATLLPGGQAWADSPEPFFGNYVGNAYKYDDQGRVVEERDITVRIGPNNRKGFDINSTTVVLVDGQRDRPGVKLRVLDSSFEPVTRRNIYMESARGSLFQVKKDPDPLEGDELQWARIEGRSLNIFNFRILEDGSYELQNFGRLLVDNGLDIRFEVYRDGKLSFSLKGHAVRPD